MMKNFIFALLFFVGITSLLFTFISICVIVGTEDEFLMAAQYVTFPKWMMVPIPLTLLIFKKNIRDEIWRVAEKIF